MKAKIVSRLTRSSLNTIPSSTSCTHIYALNVRTWYVIVWSSVHLSLPYIHMHCVCTCMSVCMFMSSVMCTLVCTLSRFHWVHYWIELDLFVCSNYGASFGTNAPHHINIHLQGCTPCMTFGSLWVTDYTLSTHCPCYIPFCHPIYNVRNIMPLLPLNPIPLCFELHSFASHTTNHHGPDSVVKYRVGSTQTFMEGVCMCDETGFFGAIHQQIYIYVHA